MNETQIIQNQLATERAHFAEVSQLCGRDGAGNSAFVAACTDYFAFAITRFEPPVAERLAATLARGLNAEFLSAFEESARDHFQKFDGMLARNLPVTEWRALARIDADSIFAERTRFARVMATRPT